MKPTKREQLAMLAALVTDFAGAICSPKLAKAALFARTTFDDDLVGQIVQWLTLNGGDWQAALKDLPDTVKRRNQARLSAFRTWAAHVCKRKVAGLLTWPEGGV